ncbi:MAG: ABC transporter substrate-binding protein, partial [Pseudomonadales bacterium]|nr:ABC transporter substrate-binding protein [Pseudomonadales bacterium]
MPVIDHLIEKSERAETMEELIAACRALDRVVMWQHYMIPVYAYDARRTLHWDRFGRPPHPKYRPAYPDGWWFDAEKAERIRLN